MADPVYHVTFTRNVPSIQERGISPLETSLWEKSGTEEKYQKEPSIYSFSNPEDALRWASKMGWQFRDEIASPSDISILRLKGGEHWEPDPSEDLSLGKSSLRSLGHIEPSDVLEITSLPNPARENKEFQAQHPKGDLEQWLKFYGSRLRGQEPRPKDQPRLPPLLEGPPEEPGKKPSKGRVMRGIGSLMRGRMFPIIRAAQAGWETLSPEARAEIEDYLKRPAHELFGMDKPGIEYFKEWLGISPEKIDAYHGTTAEFDAFEFLHGSGGDLGFHFGTSKQAKDRLKETTQYSPPEKRAKGKILSAELTLGKTLETPDMPSFEEWNSPRSVAELLLGTRWGKTRKKDLKRILSEADALNKSLDDRFETAIARDETLEWNPEFNRQLDRMDVQGRMHLLAELRNLLESDGYEGIKYVNKYEDPESRSYSYVVFDPANIRIKDEGETIQLPGPPQSKAAGGLIDKPLYDDRRMIG